MKTLRFTALDTWFFRESRPMEAIGGSELASLFPPPPRTLLGAIRSAIGDAADVDWRAFARDSSDPLRELIGFGDDLGPLALSGPWLSHDQERLYPVPLCLLRNGDRFVRLRIGQAVETGLGKVRLPELSQSERGSKPLDRHWVTGAGLERILAGGVPDAEEIYAAKDLFHEEPRLGISRDNQQRTADEGLLYQTRHLRPVSGLAVEADIRSARATRLPTGLVRLGGEGRMAHIEVIATPGPPMAPRVQAGTRGLLLVLLTPVRCPTGSNAWLPPGFAPREGSDPLLWRGEIAGISLTLHAAVLGKAQREGGWDMANRRPRAMQSLIPAGSVYYVTTETDLTSAVRALHGSCIGALEDRSLGRGLMACGLWKNDEI